MFRLFLLFTVMPVLELLVLLEVGSRIGGWSAVGLCILTGLVGAALARGQGAGVLRRMQQNVQQGVMPTREIVDGVLILVAGVLLVTPGFITDILGVSLLLPPFRALIRPYLVASVLKKATIRAQGFGDGPPPRADGPRGGGARRSAGPRPEPASRPGDEGKQDVIRPEDAPRPPRRQRPVVITVD